MAEQVPMTFRLTPDLADDLRMVAAIDGMSISDTTRAALAGWVAQRRADPEFQRRLRDRVERDRLLLERLATGAGLEGSDG